MQENELSQTSKAFVRKLFPFLGVATSLALAFISGEILVRLFFPYNTPDTMRQFSLSYIPSAYARSLLEPVNDVVEVSAEKAWGAKNTNIHASKFYFINRHGYRGPSFEVPKPKGIQRIVILGGSTVFDQNAEEGNDWPRQVERILKDNGHPRAEVVNAGIPGHASSDSLGRLYTQIWQWEPDYVLVYHAWNDIKYFNEVSYDRPLINIIRPINPDADPFKTYQGTIDYVLTNSQLYMKIRNKYFGWKYPHGSEGGIRAERRDNVGDLGVAQYRRNVELLVDASRNIGAVPILITQATLVSPTNSNEDRDRIMYGYVGLSHEGILRAYEKCRQVIWDVAKQKQVVVLDLTPQLQGQSELFSDHDHTTAQGSRVIAHKVADYLASALEHSHER